MFGTWGNNNTNDTTNNPVQGTSGGFGTDNAFSQPAQSTGAFGAFGQPHANQTQPALGWGASPANNAFGATQPATSTGSFGGGGFGSASGFTGAFGQPVATASTAGTSAFSGGAFGFPAATNSTWGRPAFGGFGAATQAATVTPQGTANPSYAKTIERESSATNVMLHYYSISCMPAYINYSPEELRVQDYAVGRINSQSNVPAAPQVGEPDATTETTWFGAALATGGFGQPAHPAAGEFGGFGTTNINIAGGGLFGDTNISATTIPQGTANPPYTETIQRESSATNVMLHYQSISCMSAYIKYSPEELRVLDYAVARENAQSNVPAAPQAGGFGAATGTAWFGAAPATGAFGQPAQPAASGFQWDGSSYSS